MIAIDQDMPAHRAKVSFRGRVCFVLSADKLASDQKNFKEIAGMLRSVEGLGRTRDGRAAVMAEWLTTLAQEYS